MILANPGENAMLSRMATMHLSLSDALKSFVEAQAADHGFDTGDAYVVELLQRERDRAKLCELVLEGANSPVACIADDAYFDHLRKIARGEA